MKPTYTEAQRLRHIRDQHAEYGGVTGCHVCHYEATTQDVAPPQTVIDPGSKTWELHVLLTALRLAMYSLAPNGKPDWIAQTVFNKDCQVYELHLVHPDRQRIVNVLVRKGYLERRMTVKVQYVRVTPKGIAALAVAAAVGQ